VDNKTQAFPPNGLNRSGLACWWSIKSLIEDSSAKGIPCYMWTLTFAKTYPDSWCGNMHSKLVTKLLLDDKAGKLGKYGFGGVRVSELHPNGHGLHFHWIIRGRLPLAQVKKRAREAGFGHIFIARDKNNRFRSVDVGAAGYVAKYLTKGDRLHGVRAWACIGNYTGVKTIDIVFESKKNEVFRQAYRTAKLAGANSAQCYITALTISARWEHFADDRDGPHGVELADKIRQEVSGNLIRLRAGAQSNRDAPASGRESPLGGLGGIPDTRIDSVESASLETQGVFNYC